MKQIILLAFVLIFASCSQDGQYMMIAHEDMTDTTQVEVVTTDLNDIIISSGMDYFESHGYGYFTLQRTGMRYKQKPFDNGFAMIGTSTDDNYYFFKIDK